jgi:NAD dependent epimerase/dehydratase
VSERVLVTGADGFIGSHVAEAMLDAGFDVRALCLYTSFGTHGWLDDLPTERRDAMELRLGDVRDERAMREAVRGCDIVLHLAALIAIPWSYEAPGSYVDTNVRGTLHVLEAVREHGARLVATSTSEVYGTPETVPIREDHPVRGQSPYSATKIAADELCRSYALSFDTPVTVLRPFNTYGPRQSLRAVIPTVLGQLLAGAPELHIGDLAPRRDFTFVSDTAEAFVAMARTELEPGTVVQLGTGHAASVADLVELCKQVTGREDARIVEDPSRVRPAGSEVQVLLSDPSRAEELLGWRARVGLREGVERTAAWLAGRVDAATAARYHR